MQNQGALIASNWHQSNQGRGGFRGRGQGFAYSRMNRLYRNARNNQRLYQVAQVNNTVNLSAIYSTYKQELICYSCFRLNKNRALEQEYLHTYLD